VEAEVVAVATTVVTVLNIPLSFPAVVAVVVLVESLVAAVILTDRADHYQAVVVDADQPELQAAVVLVVVQAKVVVELAVQAVEPETI
jgi:hypothetical protein